MSVVGAASEPADPHLSAATVTSHVPAWYSVSSRPVEDNPADAAWDGGT